MYVNKNKSLGFNIYKVKYLKKNTSTVYNNSSGAKFWGDIGAGILPFCKENNKFLIAFRSNLVNEPNTWNLWGGAIDGNLTPEQAAKLELHEEANYTGNIDIIPAYIFVSPNKTFKYYNFIGIIEKKFNPTLDWETEDYKWVTFDELLSIKPMHFGLKGLLNHKESLDIIKNLANKQQLNFLDLL